MKPVSGRSLWLHELHVESSQLQPGTYLSDDDFIKYLHVQEDLNKDYFGQLSRYTLERSGEKARQNCPVLPPPLQMELRRLLHRLTLEKRITREGKLGALFYGHAI